MYVSKACSKQNADFWFSLVELEVEALKDDISYSHVIILMSLPIIILRRFQEVSQ